MIQWQHLHYLMTDQYRGETFFEFIAEAVQQGITTALTKYVSLASALDAISSDDTSKSLLICFNLPNATRIELETKGIFYIEFRVSPVQFGKDLYLAWRTNCKDIEKALEGYAVSDRTLKLEAAHLTSSVRAQRRKQENSNTHFINLEKTTIIIGSDEDYPAPDSDLTGLPSLTAFSEELTSLDRGRRILYKPIGDEDPSAMLTWLSDLLNVSVKVCHNNAYQLLCFNDDIQLVGISANILQEAKWFAKEAVQLHAPLTAVTSEFKQIPFNTVLLPEFWHAIAENRFQPIPPPTNLPDHLCAREIFDSWGDYEKVMNWGRTIPYFSFLRSGGGTLITRLNALDRKSRIDSTEPTVSHTTAMLSLKDSCAGKTAYVLGNAASLNELNLSRLMSEDAFWCNRAFEMEKRGITFSPKYYMFADLLGFKNFSEKIMGVKAGTKFFRNDVYAHAEQDWLAELKEQQVVQFISVDDPGMHEGFFSMDAAYRTYCGRTVVLDAIQIAAYMGYSKILVGGVDLDYSQPYFFGTSINGRMPENEAIEAFRFAHQTLEKHGIELKKITHSPQLPLEYVASQFQNEKSSLS